MAGELKIMICDEDPDQRLETKRSAQRAQLEVAAEVGFGTQAVSLAMDINPDIILITVEEPVGRALETAEALFNVLPNTPMIICSSINDPDAIRRAMVVGARDYIMHPVQPDDLREAANSVLAQEERRQMRLSGQLVNQLGRGTVITVLGGKGGIGKTVLSVNLALALWRETGMSVCIMDADPELGDVATMLDLTPERTIYDVMQLGDELDRHNIRDYLTSYQGGVEVLAASDVEEVWENCTSDDVKNIIDLLAQNFDFVVVDTAGSVGRLVRACVESSTLTLVVTSGEVSSIRNTSIALRRLEAWEIPNDRLKVLLNSGARSNQVSMDELRLAVNQDIFWKVPFDKRIPTSVQIGQPLVLFEDKSKAARNILSLSRLIAGTKKPLVQHDKKTFIQSLISR